MEAYVREPMVLSRRTFVEQAILNGRKPGGIKGVRATWSMEGLRLEGTRAKVEAVEARPKGMLEDIKRKEAEITRVKKAKLAWEERERVKREKAKAAEERAEAKAARGRVRAQALQALAEKKERLKKEATAMMAVWRESREDGADQGEPHKEIVLAHIKAKAVKALEQLEETDDFSLSPLLVELKREEAKLKTEEGASLETGGGSRPGDRGGDSMVTEVATSLVTGGGAGLETGGGETAWRPGGGASLEAGERAGLEAREAASQVTEVAASLVTEVAASLVTGEGASLETGLGAGPEVEEETITARLL